MVHTMVHTMVGKDRDHRLDAGHGDGNARSESDIGTEAARSLDDQARTRRHARGRGGLKALNNI